MNQDTNNFNQQGNNGMFNPQNQNMEQNNNVNQQPMFNSTLNNNMYQQPVSQNNVPNTNPTNNSPKQNKTKIIGIVVAVVVVLFVGVMLFGGGSSSSGGHTVGYGETLEISEIDGYYDFDIDVLSIEKDYPIDSYFYSGDCFALKVNIKNNSASNLSLLSLIHFTLINSSNNEVASLNMIASSIVDGSIEDEISSGKSASGYLYFYNIDNDGYGSNIDDSDISKLKISVPKELDKTGDVITGNYNDYYINLK